MVCYLRLIKDLKMLDFLRQWEPFMPEKDLYEIAKESLEEIEKEKGHNLELIKKRATKGEYWQKLLLKKLAEKKKKRKKLVIETSEPKDDYLTEEESPEQW